MAELAANQDPKATHGRVSPPGGSTLARLAGIGVLLLGVVGAFLYLGGWFSPQKLTPARFVDEFQRVDGTHSGFRRNHAKGVCVRGFFDSNGQGTRLSKAVVFRSGRVPVIGRFSIGRRRSPCQRRTERRPWPGASVFSRRRRTVADRDDQSAGIPVQGSASLLRQPGCIANPTPRRINPTRRKGRRSSRATRKRRGRSQSSRAMRRRPVSTTAPSTGSMRSVSSMRDGASIPRALDARAGAAV